MSRPAGWALALLPPRSRVSWRQVSNDADARARLKIVGEDCLGLSHRFHQAHYLVFHDTLRLRTRPTAPVNPPSWLEHSTDRLSSARGDRTLTVRACAALPSRAPLQRSDGARP